MEQAPYKVLCLGPKCVGKTAICNFLADKRSVINRPYVATMGVRICDMVLRLDDELSHSTNVELWDVSGDPKFSGCWNAIGQDAEGILFVYDPSRSDSEKDLLFWNRTFNSALRLPPNCMLVFAHRARGAQGRGEDALSTPDLSSREGFREVPVQLTNIEMTAERIKRAFRVLIRNVKQARSHREEEFLLRS